MTATQLIRKAKIAMTTRKRYPRKLLTEIARRLSNPDDEIMELLVFNEKFQSALLYWAAYGLRKKMK